MQKRKSFTIFSSVISALLLREIQTRVGEKKFGYFWLIFDAMILIIGLVVLRGLIREIDILGVDILVFLATSFLAFFLFKNIITQSMNSFTANKALFNYKQVKPITTIFARVILEIFLTIFATLVMIGMGLYLELDLTIQNFNMVLVSVAWLCVFAFGIGLFTAVISSFYEWFKKFVTFLMMPLLFLSALFYTVDSLPQIYQEMILYNPVVHFIEMIHGYYFNTLSTKYVDYTYMTYWTLIPLFLGLFFYTKSEKKIISS